MKKSKIGYACIPITVSARTSRTLLLKNFNYDDFYNKTLKNIQDLKLILQHNIKNNIYLFRISSDIIPLGSHEINNINWWELFKSELEDIGAFIKEKNIRVSMHPGQYTVINSNKPEVVEKSLKDFEYHTLFLDSMKLDFTHKIVLHIGGVYGDKTSAKSNFINNFKKLSENAQKRLVIENDDKSYTIEDVLHISQNLQIPVVFDNLHHYFNPSTQLSTSEILSEVSKTWKQIDGTMKLHYSDSSSSKKNGAHSQFVILENFLNYYNEVSKFSPDIMLEVKDKDISAIKCIQCISYTHSPRILTEMWAKYKYLVMEKNYKLYKNCSLMVKNFCSLIDFYKFVDVVMLLPFDEKNYLNTVYHVWGYFKNSASEKEKSNFNNLIENREFDDKFKNFLYKLAIKYDQKYLLDSYYFYY